VSPNAEKQIFGDPLPAEILKKKAIEKETCVRQRSFFRILLGRNGRFVVISLQQYFVCHRDPTT
jgi:hypothetical protein